MILVMVAGLLLLSVALRFGIRGLRRHRLARELRGDWWARFERDFRQYSHQFTKDAREAEWRQ